MYPFLKCKRHKLKSDVSIILLGCLNIVIILEPFLSIRTNPTVEQAKVINSLDICRSICGAVFILLLNDNVLKDVVSIILLAT